ncbi:MAG: hypothetical protein AAGM67_10340, partial [Bacteroidota bacterium]
MSWQRLIWLHTPYGERLELSLQKSLFLQDTPDAKAQQTLRLFQQMLQGQLSEHFFADSRSCVILERKIKRTRSCLVFGIDQGISRGFWLRNGFEEELFFAEDGALLSFGERQDR